MMDRRYPNLCRIEHAPGVNGCDMAVLVRAARAIESRTNCKVCLRMGSNGRGGNLHVYPIDPGFAYTIPGYLTVALTPENGLKNGLESRVDEIVQCVQRAKRPMKEHERDAAYAEKSEASEREQHDGRHFESIKPALEEKLRRKSNRRGMSTKYRPSAVVDGLKGVA